MADKVRERSEFDLRGDFIRVFRIIHSHLEQVQRDETIEALYGLAGEISRYLFEQLHIAADARNPVTRRQRSLRKLRVALRALRPPGRPYKGLDFGVSDDWADIKKLHQEFVKLMRACDGNVDESSASEAIRRVRLALGGDVDAKDFVKNHAPSLLANRLGLDEREHKRLLADLAKIKRPNRSLMVFAGCAIRLKYGISARAAREELKRAGIRPPGSS